MNKLLKVFILKRSEIKEEGIRWGKGWGRAEGEKLREENLAS